MLFSCRVSCRTISHVVMFTDVMLQYRDSVFTFYFFRHCFIVVCSFANAICTDTWYSGFSITRPAVCQFNLDTARISNLVRISRQSIKSYCIPKPWVRPIIKRYYCMGEYDIVPRWHFLVTTLPREGFGPLHRRTETHFCSLKVISWWSKKLWAWPVKECERYHQSITCE